MSVTGQGRLNKRRFGYVPWSRISTRQDRAWLVKSSPSLQPEFPIGLAWRKVFQCWSIFWRSGCLTILRLIFSSHSVIPRKTACFIQIDHHAVTSLFDCLPTPYLEIKTDCHRYHVDLSLCILAQLDETSDGPRLFSSPTCFVVERIEHCKVAHEILIFYGRSLLMLFYGTACRSFVWIHKF